MSNDTAFPNMVMRTQNMICRRNLSSNRFYLDIKAGPYLKSIEGKFEPRSVEHILKRRSSMVRPRGICVIVHKSLHLVITSPIVCSAIQQRPPPLLQQ